MNYTDFMMENDQPAIIKALIIEDQRELREGLQTLINFTDGFKCMGAFRTAEEGISRAKFEPPDVVLTDIGLPGIDSIEGIRRLKGNVSEFDNSGADHSRRQRANLRRALRGRLRLFAQENAADQTSGKHSQSRHGRRADVAGSGESRD